LEAGFFIAGLLALQPKETAMAARPTMRKIAVFGNAGGGKSRLAKRLAEATNLPLYCLDMIQFRAGRYWPEEKGGGKIPDDEYLTIHADIIERDEWIIDGYGSMDSVLGTVRRSRYARIHRPAAIDPLQVGHEPTCQGPLAKPAGLARE